MNNRLSQSYGLSLKTGWILNLTNSIQWIKGRDVDKCWIYEGSISGLIIDPEIKYSKPTIASPTPIGVLGTFKVIPAVNNPKKNKIINPITKDKVNS